MKKKQFLQFRRAMATLLAVAMIGQNTVVTTAENFVVDTQAVVAEEQTQEPEVQVTEAAAPAVQEAAPEVEPVVQTAPETPTEPVVQAETETPTEPAAQAAAETPTEPAAQAAAETPAEPTAQPVAETPTEPAAQAAVETPAESAGQAQSETPAAQPEVKPEEPSAPQEPAATSAPAQNNSQEESKPEEQPAEPNSEANNGQANAENGAENSQEGQPAEEAKETLYHVTFDEHAADFGKIQVRGEAAPVENISSYKKEVKENESFAFSVKANDGYEVDHVRFADTQADIQKNADGLYEIQAVTKDEKVTVTYKAVAQAPVAEPTEVPVVEEPAEENNIATLKIDETNHEQNVITYYEVVFKYEDKDGNVQTLTTQQIENGKSAVAPAAPEKEGYRFIGWDKDFSNVTADMEVIAQYSEIGAKVKYQIIYQYTDGTVAAQPWAAELEKGVTYENTITSPQLEGFSVDQPTVTFSGKVEADQIITVTYTGTATTYTVKHLLQNTDGKTYTEDACETIDGTTGNTTVAAARVYKGFTAQDVSQTKVNADGSTVVEIKYDRNSYRLTWNTDGGSYVEPSDILYGANITLPKEPTKLGYTFKGWENCPTTMPAEDTIVTAKWEINAKAAYRIIYWQESLETPGTYEMAKNNNGEADIVDGTGAVGKNISYSVEKNRYEGFEPETKLGLNEGDVEITADGLAVKNIYYVRKTYTITFYVNGNEDTELKIVARYGEDVSSQWNDEKHSKKKWATTSDGGTYYTNFSNMPAKNLSMYGFKKQEGADIVYYIETLDGKIKEYQSYNIAYSRLTSEDAQPIDGFSFNMNDSLNYGWYKDGRNYVKNKSSFKDKVTGKSRYGAFLYYSRNSYVLHFENCIGVADASIKFEANVSSSKPLDKNVQPPANVDSDYNFDGWYTSPACEDGTEFDWQTTMPSHTITLYAKWKAPTYTVTFEPNGGTVTESTLTVTKGQTLGDTLPTPTKEGDEFLGWYTDESFTHKFVKESQIVKDQTLYAKWKSSDIITYYIVAKDTAGKELWRSEAQSIEKGKNASVNAQPIANYYPQELSKSVIINNDKQEIVFIYKPLESWTYTVRYVDENGKDIGTAEPVTTTDNMRTVVYKVFEGYQLTSPAVVQAIKGQTTEIVFTYAAPKATYTVEHWLQNPDGTYYKKEFESKGAEKIGAWVTATPKGYTGFTCVSGEIERSGAVVKGGSLVLKVYYNRASLSVEDYNGKYNGQEHTITITAPGIDGDVIQYQIGDGQWTDLNDNFTNLPKYKDCGTTVIKVRVANNGNVGPAVEAKISITQRKITLTSAKDEKFYDGTALTNNTITVGGEDKFVEGEGVASYEVTGSQTEVGESDNVFDYTLKENTKLENYEIKKEYGKLKVKAVDAEVVVTITEHSGTGIYDGNKQTVTGYEVTNISNKLYSEKDFSFNGNATIEGTNAGSYNMELKAADFENISKNFTNVKFVIVDGTLEITKRPVTIEAKASSKVYGNPDPAFELATMNNNVEGELKDLDLTVIRSDADDDTVKTHKDVLRIDASKEALEKEYTNYTFTIIPADFTILESENGLIVTAPDVVKKYDGNSYGVTATAKIANAEIENPNITIKYWNEETQAYDLDESPVYKNVTDTPAVVKFEASLYGYKSVQSEATVTINKRSVTLTSESAAKVYDGTPLTRPDVTIGEDGFVDGEVFDVKAIGSVTNVVDSPKKNAITFTPVEGKFNADNYAIEQVEGELKITPVTDEVTVTIAGHTDSAKYDGTPKNVTGYDITINNKLYKEADIDFSGKATAEGVKADHYPMGLSTADFANNNENFINVKFVVTDGYLDITKRTLTLTSGTANKVYDGTPLTNDTITVSGDGFVHGEGATYDVTGTQTEVGFSENKFTYELNDGTNPANYDIVPAYGALTVAADQNEVVVTIKGNIKDAKYDGTEKSVSGYEVTSISSKLYTIDDFKFNGTAEIKATDADSYDMGLTAANFENTSKNFEKVTFIVTDGRLNIAKRNVTLTSASASKVYDGTPLTAKDVVVTGDGFAKGEGATYNVTGSQLNKGSSANTFEYTLNDNTKKKNYNIVPVNGELTVDPVTAEVVVTITENSGDFEYDGTEKQAEGYTVTDISYPVYTEKDFTISENASQKVTATDAGTYDMNLKADDFTNINDNFAKVIFKIVDGTLKIDPRAISIEAGSATKKYDGTPLTNVEYKIVKGLLAAGQTELVSVEGSQTLVGSSANVIAAANIFAEIDGEKVDVTKNYAITPVDGKLEVTDGTDEEPVDPNHVVTKNHDDSKAYDLGDTVIFTISVTNIYDTAKNITITELPGVVLEGAPAETPNILVKNAVPAGETITVKATYTVTEKDVANGSFVNRVKAEFEGGKPFENTDTVTTVDPVRSYTLTKKSSESTHENGMFKAGETIHYTLKLTNTGNQTLENIEITDTLKAAGTITNIQGAEYKQDGNLTAFTISSLAPKAEATITYDYVVQEADKGNTISNAAVGTPANPDGKEPEGNTDNTVENPKLEVKKDVIAITAADGTEKDKAGKADLHDTITYNVTVTNSGNVKLTDVKITDSLEGIQLTEGQSFDIGTLEAGEAKTVTYTYQVKESDLGKSILNTATATGKVPDDPEDAPKPEGKDEKEVPTEDSARSYTITKKASESTHENGMFKSGETIHYTLKVTNTGNQTLENIEITDTLKAAGTIANIQGAEYKQDGKATIFMISSLAPKAEATITYDYVVQEADKGNTISNAAVGTPANPDDPDGDKPGDNTDNPVENPKLEVKKDVVAITAADGTQKDKAGKADLNDTITYSVTVTNTGNVKLTNVKITDSLEGIQLAEGQSFDIGTLEAGEAKTVTYTYQVKESDLGKSILNTATATGDVPEDPADTPKPEGKDEKEVPTEDPANCSITVTKRLTNIQGDLLAVRAADFYVTLFSDEAMTQKAADTKMIHFDENQGTSSVTFDQLKRGTYYVAETDAEGKVVAEGIYNNGSYVAQYQAGNKVEITENGTAAQFQFDNQFLLLPDEYYIVKTITITKNVLKKNGEDLKSDETFYAGIFKDEDCTQLADGVSQNIVPLAMNGESTATANVEVTVPVGGEEVKLYVTEVTADGTPVALDDTFEYDVEINDGFVTLSETSENAAVTIINTSKKDEPEPTAEPTPEPTEVPAEPTKAPQITQQPEERAVTTNNVKTGDDSPLTQLAFMLFAASAAIMLVVFLRKKDEKDMMK